jgi:uncharacterized damage-inducible protein DinB
MYLAKMLEGISNEDLQLSTGESNSIGWILGHIVLGRGQILQKLNKECDIKETEKVFDRGAEKRKDLTFNTAEMLNMYAARGEKITEAINYLDDAAMAQIIDEKLPPMMNTTETFLSFIAWHETFHIGQIDLIKAAAGKGGIK